MHDAEDLDLPDSLVQESQSPHLAQFDDLGERSNAIKPILYCFRQAVLCRKYRIAAPNGIRIILNVAEFEILDHIQDESHTPEDHRFKTLLLATHVFLYAGLRQLPTMGPMVKLLVSRLRDALEAGEVNAEAWKDHLSDFLWVLFVGAAASTWPKEGTGYGHAYGERALWFRSRLELVVRMLGIETQAGLEAVLHQVVWADEFGRDFLSKWWREISADQEDGRDRLPQLLAALKGAGEVYSAA